MPKLVARLKSRPDIKMGISSAIVEAGMILPVILEAMDMTLLVIAEMEGMILQGIVEIGVEEVWWIQHCR